MKFQNVSDVYTARRDFGKDIWSGIAGGTLGYVTANVPGAVVGARLGYKWSKASRNLPKNKSMPGNPYPTPSRTPRKRKASIQYGSAGLKKIRSRLFVGAANRQAYLSAVRRPSKRNGRKRGGQRKRVRKGRRGAKRFRRPTSRKAAHNTESTYQSLGYHKTIEQYGTVSDPNCVFLGHSSVYLEEMSFTIKTALMRKILNKAGFKITNQWNEVQTSDPIVGTNGALNSFGLRFVYEKKNAFTGGYAVYTYDTVDNQTFNQICTGFSDMSDQLLAYFRGAASSQAAQNDEPYRLAVYKYDTGVIGFTAWRLGAEMFLEDCTLDVMLSSTMCIQNRTKAALDDVPTSTVGYDADRIDAQPLKGMLYEFKNGEPRIRHGGPSVTITPLGSNQIFNRTCENGLNLIRGGDYIAGEEPFVPKYFGNIVKATTVYLQPGEMKKTTFKYNFKGRFLNIIKKMQVTRWNGGSGTASFVAGTTGKCQMIALEEVMRTNSSNKVTCGYERELKIGCIVGYKYSPVPLETGMRGDPIDMTSA